MTKIPFEYSFEVLARRAGELGRGWSRATVRDGRVRLLSMRRPPSCN